jgi:hypothetical protein
LLSMRGSWKAERGNREVENLIVHMPINSHSNSHEPNGRRNFHGRIDSQNYDTSRSIIN